MKKTKEILSMLLAIIMVISVFSITASAETTSGAFGDTDNLTWLFEGLTLTISGNGDMPWNFTYGSAPWDLYKDSIVTVIIENGVTSIAANAFACCTYLKSITIPVSVTRIHHYALYSNSNVNFKDVYYEGSRSQWYDVELGEAYGFEPHPFNLVKVHYECKSGDFGYSVISETSKAIKITEYKVIPARNDKIEPYDIEIPSTINGYTVTEIGDYAFYDKSKILAIELPSTVTKIGKETFRGCTRLNSINLPDGLKEIGDGAFYNCDSIKEIAIPKSVITIGDNAFYHCNALQAIKADSKNQYYSSDETGVLFNKGKTELIQYPIANTRESYIIPDSVKTIGNYAFYDCDNIKKVIIPDNVTTIDDYAFYACNNISDVYFMGTEEQWDAISIGRYNSPLINATIHFDHKNNHTPAEGVAGIYTAPTCTEKGYTTYSCSECGMEYKDDYVDALGHDYLTPTYVAPPCTQKGYTIYECHCGASALKDFVDITGHIDSENDGICDQCNRNLNPSTTGTPDFDISGISGIFSIFTIIAELFEKLFSVFGFLKV